MIDFGYGTALDAPSAEDKEYFYSWRNDPRVWLWCRQNGPLSYSQHTAYWYAVEGSPTEKMFAVKANSQTIGCAGLTSIDETNSRAEFSLYIGPSFRRRGYAKAALKTLVNYGFTFLNLNSIWGETFEGNPALGMFLDIGMKEEGMRRSFYYRNGKYIDAHLVSILADEWKSQPLKLS